MKLDKENIREMLKGFGASELGLTDEWLSKLANTINKRFGDPILPQKGESLALTLSKPKTAALAFDKVYRMPIVENLVPKEVGFYCATESEVVITAKVLLLAALDETGASFEYKLKLENYRAERKSNPHESERSLRILCSDFQKEYGITPTILYNNLSSGNKEFRSGKREILTSSISNIAMVDEKELSWEQILEFRKDSETRAKYCRFVRWVDLELKTKSPKEVEDLIAVRLDDYQWALKKHGLKTSVGTLSCLLDPKFLAGTSAAVAATSVTGGSIWGALAGASLVFGRAVVNFGTAKIDGLDESRKENYEVAYVHEVQKQLGKDK